MAEAERTALEFQATLKDVKVDIPKEVSGGFGQKPNGGLLLTLRVDRPKPPAEPRVPYELREPYGPLSLKAIGPEPVRKKKGETDEEFAGRAAAWEREMARRGEALVRHEAATDRWRHQMESWGDVLRAYASITGLAAAFGDSPIQVSLTPLQTDFFAGMGVLSLPAPGDIDAAYEAGVDYDDDEEESFYSDEAEDDSEDADEEPAAEEASDPGE